MRIDRVVGRSAAPAPRRDRAHVFSFGLPQPGERVVDIGSATAPTP